jgi:type IV pilus assembly protein PilM
VFFKKGPGIGLDIGSKKIKLVQVKRHSTYLEIVKFKSIFTPPAAIETGYIVDPQRLGQEIGILVKDLSLKGRRVVSMIPAQHVYTQNIILPRMNPAELKEAITYQAMMFLPIPIEETVIDFCPFREFRDEEGEKIEVFFTAARKQHLEKLIEAVQIAGLKLAVAEIEPLAIYRILGTINDSEIKAFLNIGASRSYFSVFKRNILISFHSLAFGSSLFLQDMDFHGNGLDKIDINVIPQYNNTLRDVINEVFRTVEYYNLNNRGQEISKIILCGGGARIRGLDKSLSRGVGCSFEIANILPGLILPENINEDNKRELQYDFPAAVGLAAREVV